MNYLVFDNHLHKHGTLANHGTIPLGYDDFRMAWNNGAHPNDPCCISTFIPGNEDQPNKCIPATDPITLKDFFIIPEQCGLIKQQNKCEEACAIIFKDYATNQAMRKMKIQRHYDQRESKQQKKFGFSDKKWKFNQINDDHDIFEDSTDLALFNAANGDFETAHQPVASTLSNFCQGSPYSTVNPEDFMEDPQ